MMAMGFLDKFKKKKEDETGSSQVSAEKSSSQGSGQAKKIKKYNSEGKPLSD